MSVLCVSVRQLVQTYSTIPMHAAPYALPNGLCVEAQTFFLPLLPLLTEKFTLFALDMIQICGFNNEAS